MKKKIILSFAVLTLFITAVAPIYAKESSLLPPWFTNAIKPIQDSISSLFTKTGNHEARIAELEKKVDFNLPNQWSVSFYQEQNSKESIVMRTTDSTGNQPDTINLPNTPPNYCNWKGASINSSVSARAVAHLPTGDIFGAGSCMAVEFDSIENLPENGSSFEVEIYLWWQGTEKHIKQTISIPDRPFPTWNSLLISPSSNGLSIQGTGTIGIGTTSPGISISNPPDSDLLKINN